MQARLLTRRTACLVLAWFVAFIAVAGLAPWARAEPLESICTSAGVVKSGPQGAGESDAHTGHPLGCVLCAGLAAPPPAAVLPSAVADLGHALQPLVSAHILSLTRAALPARGPPFFS